MYGQDGIECYECEATYGSFKYAFATKNFYKTMLNKGSDEDIV